MQSQRRESYVANSNKFKMGDIDENLANKVTKRLQNQQFLGSGLCKNNHENKIINTSIHLYMIASN